MKTTIEELIFPESIKTKLKMKVSQSNLKIEYISGHIIKFNKINLSIMEPHKIIISNNKTTLIELLLDYMKENKIKCKAEAIRKCLKTAVSIEATYNMLKDMNSKLNRIIYRENNFIQIWYLVLV